MKSGPVATEPKVRVNDEIRARQVRVISEDGEQLGIMGPLDAVREAESRGLDLVEVAPLATPPVCRIMDYGKYRYEQKRRMREARKHQHTVNVKEVKYRPKIDKHDLEFKNGHVREFLEQGNKVKVTIMFRGREMAHPEFGREILAKVVEASSDITAGEYDVTTLPIEGRNMSMVLQPSRAILKKVATKQNLADQKTARPASPATSPETDEAGEE